MNAPPRSGVLLVAKPQGPTSHDVVALVRRRLGTRRVGHAGTLDPMATGLLVVLVGEATKLEPFLAASRKAYTGRVALGRSTTTLDAEGETVETAPIPPSLTTELASLATGDPASPTPCVAAALSLERARGEQIPPLFSAIRVGGVRSYERARRGEATVLASRPVRVERLDAVAASPDPPWLDVSVVASKGYYVRSLARDIGLALGCPAHLSRLHRRGSGAFSVEEAVDATDRAIDLGAHLLSPAEAASRELPTLRVDATQARLIESGRILDASRVEGASGLSEGAPIALLEATSGVLVAIGRHERGEIASLRGFRGA